MDTQDGALGSLLVALGVLTPEALARAGLEARRQGVALRDVLPAMRLATPAQIVAALGQFYRVPVADLTAEPADMALVRSGPLEQMRTHRTIPLRRDADGGLTVATADPGPATVVHVAETWGPARIVLADPFEIEAALQAAFREVESHDAVFALAERDPVMSAQTVASGSQMLVLYGLLSVILFGLGLFPVGTLIALNLLFTLFYLGNFIFKAVLVWSGGDDAATAREAAIAAEARLLRDADLPTYTVLVPMFREPDVLPILVKAIRELDYPLAKLDIKLVLEETDHETIEAAQSLGLESIFQIVRVPQSHPQTKPKACNYALRYARGEYLVIFDAEDKPEPDQLKKVVATFRQSPPNTACVQCRLNYFNARENWLTRMFTLDYSLWFDLMLPGLERLGVPIPLGGTSNHFRMDVLRELNAWDPFNVTEDADLGIRLYQKGYRVSVIASTTFEEANVSIPNWVRQRSRWIKGYMQTFLVHTRRPVHLARSVGLLGTIGFVFFIGGTFLSGLLNPIFWGIFLIWLAFAAVDLSAVFPTPILVMAIMNLLLGNGLLIYLSMIAPTRRRWGDLAPWGITVVGYWVLMTIAAYKALWQLVTNPFYWEKTTHGLSKNVAEELAAAKESMG